MHGRINEIRPLLISIAALAFGCSAPELSGQKPAIGSLAVRNARLPGGASVELLIRDGAIEYVGPRAPVADRERDLGGKIVVPAVIDSHVHLAYWPVGNALAESGVAGAVDLAAPLATLGRGDVRLRVAASGPMITAARGYPTRSWGADGYGLEVADAAGATNAVAALANRGADVIKVALGSDGLGRGELEAVVAAARARGLKVAAHALSAADVALAADAGVEILAHTPIEPIGSELAARWRGRYVITTLAAFAPLAAAANLRRLLAAGAIAVYGTDLGNTRELGVSRSEIAAMTEAGMSPRAIIESMTTTPAKLWGWHDLGAIEPRRRTPLLVLDRDPLEDPMALASAVEVLRE